MISFILLLTIFLLSLMNGIQDTVKGIATLWGSKKMSFYNARLWSLLFVTLGSIASLYVADTLVSHFQFRELVPDAIGSQLSFYIAIALSSVITLVIATKFGFPVATTHALIGGIIGVSFVSAGVDVNWGYLIGIFLLPLFLSPILSILTGWFLYAIWRKLMPKSFKRFSRVRYPSQTWHEHSVIMLHIMSAAWVSFNRGLNDTPKFIGLLVALNLSSKQYHMSIWAIVISLFIGGFFGSKQTARTMAKFITKLKPYRGLIASLNTGAILFFANLLALPVSMTHIMVGSIYGVGFRRKRTSHKMMLKIGLAWILTMPLSAVMGALIYVIVQ